MSVKDPSNAGNKPIANVVKPNILHETAAKNAIEGGTVAYPQER
jgi:hypothetical protein